MERVAEESTPTSKDASAHYESLEKLAEEKRAAQKDDVSATDFSKTVVLLEAAKKLDPSEASEIAQKLLQKRNEKLEAVQTAFKEEHEIETQRELKRLELEDLERQYEQKKEQAKKSEKDLVTVNKSIHSVAARDPNLVAPQVLQTIPKPAQEEESSRRCTLI